MSEQTEEVSMKAIYNAIHGLNRQLEEQTAHIKVFELQMKENTNTVIQIKEAAEANSSTIKVMTEDTEKIKLQI